MKKLVLVAVVNREKDLDIAINRHWYRIPLRYAPKKKADFLALYQTRVFARKGKSMEPYPIVAPLLGNIPNAFSSPGLHPRFSSGGINFYAPIKKYSIACRRNLLPEEKNHPRVEQLYQKLTLGPFRQTPRRIKNKTGLRVNFGFTTLEKLLQAKEIGQLFNIAPLEQIMSRELQKNNIKTFRQYCIMKNSHCRYRLDFAVFCKKGKIDIECDNEKWHKKPKIRIKDRKRNCWLEKNGWSIIRFPCNQIITNPYNCIRKIKQTIHSLTSHDKISPSPFPLPIGERACKARAREPAPLYGVRGHFTHEHTI